MAQILADRFIASGHASMNLASGAPVRLHLVRAGPSREQADWNDQCARLANLRHPLINPLIDYGTAGTDHLFEAYAVQGPLRSGRRAAERLLEHAMRFLQTHGVVLDRFRAELVLRPIESGPWSAVQAGRCGAAAAGRIRRDRGRSRHSTPSRHVRGCHRRGLALGSANNAARGIPDGEAQRLCRRRACRAGCAPVDHRSRHRQARLRRGRRGRRRERERRAVAHEARNRKRATSRVAGFPKAGPARARISGSS